MPHEDDLPPVHRLTLGPDDVLVVTAPAHISAQQAEVNRAAFASAVTR